MQKKLKAILPPIALTTVCLAVNLCGIQLALSLKLPLFLDCVGTVVAAALGGYLPGILVGLLTNLLQSIQDPVTLYYGFINMLIAMLAARLAGRGVLKSFWRTLTRVPAFAALGGGLGSLITWFLYGEDFGTGISAPLAHRIYNSLPLGKFGSQLTADLGIDLLDKLVCLGAALLIIKGFSAAMGKLAPGRQRGLGGSGAYDFRLAPRHSLRGKVIGLIVATACVLGVLAAGIGYKTFQDRMYGYYEEVCRSAARLAVSCVDAVRINDYLEPGGEESRDYRDTQSRLTDILRSDGQLAYLYVYQIRPDGCHVVFDVDTPTTPGGSPGSLVPFDESFNDEALALLLEGEEPESMVGSGAYGYLLTVYLPIYDSAGGCVAYAGADIAMDALRIESIKYIVRILSLLCGVTLLILTFSMGYAEREFVRPLNAITEAANSFAYDTDVSRLSSTRRVKELKIETGDEIQNLYDAISKTVSDLSDYIQQVNDKAALIARMQDNIIISFADMVENRDENTGSHIRRTAAYVDVVGRSLGRMGAYPEILNEQYLVRLRKSAPLHDIGKIKIPDAILNKPGRLTPEEFDVIKTHTTEGWHILRDALAGIEEDSDLAFALDMVLSHHERWDGAGYPQGLAGEDIPLSARIMAVADVFDALRAKRSYKEAMPFDRAVEEIMSESGSHFDPAVTAAFMSALDELRAVE